MSSQAVPVQKADMHVPPMKDVASVLSEGLGKNFVTVSVNVVDCPDLTQKPFNLSAPGLNGNPRLADIGGPPYLTPLPQLNKVYTFSQIAELVELPGAFMIGAGAGPHRHVGCCCELINDVKLDKAGNISILNSHIAKVNTEDGGCLQEKLTKNEFSLMGNFLCCDGNPGKVIEVKASQRSGKENFMSCIRKVLHSNYGTKPVALGGVFLVEKGKANLHIMKFTQGNIFNMSDSVVLVTGGSGCLGQHIVKHLQILGNDVKEIRVLDIVEYKQKLGTETILKACKEQNVAHLIYCSLSIFYGPQAIVGGTETTVKQQRKLYFGAYASTKAQAQKMVLDANESRLTNGKPLRTLAILPVPLYGELDYHNITPSVQPFKNKTYTLIGPIIARVHYYYTGNRAFMFIKAMEALKLNRDLGGEYFFAADDTPPDTFLGTIKPFFDQFNVSTTTWHVPYWLIMLFVFIIHCLLYVIRLFKPVDAANIGFTTGSISFLNTTCHVTYDKAKTLLGYKPLYDYDTSIKMSKIFYAKAV